MHFGLVSSQDISLHNITLPGCRTITLDDESHLPIISALESGYSTASMITSSLKLDQSQVQDGLLNLLIAEQIKPIACNVPSDLALKEYRKNLIAFLEEAIGHDEHVIPSLQSGSGIIINKDTALFLLATIIHAEDAIDWIAEWMEFHGYGTFNITRIHAEESYSTFTTTIPFWKRMRIL